MNPQEETKRQAEEALKESERITLGIVEGGIPKREGSVYDAFDKAKAAMIGAQMEAAGNAAMLEKQGKTEVGAMKWSEKLEKLSQQRPTSGGCPYPTSGLVGNVAAYRIPAPVPLSDLRERLEMCRRSGVTHYEDQVLKITFSPTANRSHDGLSSPTVEAKRW